MQTSFIALAILVSGCGGRVGENTPGPKDLGETPPGTPPTHQGVPSGCDITINELGGGHTYAGASTTASGSVNLTGNSLDMSCGFKSDTPVPHGRYLYTYIGLPPITSPGHYVSNQVSVNESCSALECNRVFNDGSCDVDIETIAPATRGGFFATFSCPEVASYTGLALEVHGKLTLPAPTPDTPDLPGEDTSCTLKIEGAYPTSATGTGSNSGCSVTSGGVSYWVSPFYSPPTVTITGASWCSSCTITYASDQPCTTVVSLDEGVDGRFVATFACSGLVAADGTKLSVEGSIDGTHLAPPI